MAKRVIKLTESDIRNIVNKVIEEQYPGMYGYYAGMQAMNSAPSQKIINIANIKKTVDAQGIIRNSGTAMFNNTRWVDYLVKYGITDEEIKKADEYIKTSAAAAKTQNEKFNNIVTMVNATDVQGVIRNPASKWDGKTLASYMETYGITPAEAEKAKAYVASKTPPATTPQATQNDKRMQNIVTTLRNVDATGIIKNSPTASLNNMKWEDYVKTYSVTADEIAKAKQQIGGGQSQQQTRQQRQPDPAIVKIQQDLKAKGYNLGTTGANRDGVDGVMGPKTRAAVEAEKAKSAGTTTQSTTTTPDNLGINSPDFATRMAADYARRNPYKTTDLRSTLTPEQQKTLDDINKRYGQQPTQ